SPIFCTSACRAFSTVPRPGARDGAAAASAGFFSATTCANFLANATKSALRATKSVSQFNSTMAPVLPSAERNAPITPSAAMRSAAFDALAPLRMRSSSSAFAASPPVSASAFLHSIMGSPVRLRRSITMLAVISAMLLAPGLRVAARQSQVPSDALRFFIPTGCRSNRRDRSKRGRGSLRSRRRFVSRYFDEFIGLNDFLDHLAATFEDCVGDTAGIQANRAARVVVAGYHVG